MTTKLLGARLSLHSALQSAPITKFIPVAKEPESRSKKLPKDKAPSIKKAMMNQVRNF
jgi:hypothetical protein